MADIFISALITTLFSTISGCVIALFTHWLSEKHKNK
ncbi:type I toxin-antitoxin system Fst family toxin [Staphylococcus debuckii]|uniref:Type I toxin-antitoxin system Fst family toxin n=1 Tax=Staphylococcus debuckii TaxID=2044912 RepID=A0ABU9EXH9_9STAP|nr:type I toxin-antitoxin system Fst family toxin [Staphylococcus debuckii]AYU56268.1 type I toxin-antitoxin system Fst family toxin [Staphylococcus debuckii]